ncbi:hypothetical protein GLYMA_15G176250v4 [Glycine max]|nr:hypothetical protein GLYMA_15G176250v4 [Glycine max]KAH1147673.1 hypothetical protein GYH30_042693 [Glycine max]
MFPAVFLLLCFAFSYSLLKKRQCLQCRLTPKIPYLAISMENLIVV